LYTDRAPVTANPASKSKPSAPPQQNEDRHDIRTIPWKDLWKILRFEGWSWDFGPGHLNYFYVPGFDYKQDKEAILGIHKFDSEEAIRRYIKNELRVGGAEAKEKWSMFYIAPPSSSTSSSSLRRIDSQQESQVIDDATWTLVTHRKRRESAPVSVVSSLLNDQNDDGPGNESSIKRTKSMKRRRSLDGKNSTAVTMAAAITTPAPETTAGAASSQDMILTQAQGYPTPSPLEAPSRIRPPPESAVRDILPASPMSASSSASNIRFPKQNALVSMTAPATTKAVKEAIHIFDGITFIFSGIAEKQRYD
jgi:hypothetical protein